MLAELQLDLPGVLRQRLVWTVMIPRTAAAAVFGAPARRQFAKVRSVSPKGCHVPKGEGGGRTAW